MSSRPLLLGHRGDKAFGENSLAAFDRALDAGCGGFEFDVRLTSAGRLVICHDETVNGVVVSRAGAADLLELTDLPAVLRRFSRRAFLDIEIKVAGIEAQVAKALAELPPERGCVVSSFPPEVIRELKARAEVPLGIICKTRRQLAGWRELPVEYVIAHKSLLTEKLIQSVHDAGRRIFVWTVNDSASMERMARWGVDGIISDYPDRLVRALTRVATAAPAVRS